MFGSAPNDNSGVNLGRARMRARTIKQPAHIVYLLIVAVLFNACSSANGTATPSVLSSATIEASPAASVSAAPLQDITFMMDTNFLPKHGLFFAAAGFGFYAAQGFNVSIVPGTGSAAGAAAVVAGKATFSFGDYDTIAKAIAGGATVKEIGVVHAVSPNAFVTLKSTGITKISQLVGKTVAVEPNVGFVFELPAIEKLCGIPDGSIKMINVASTAKDAMLISGSADAIMAYSISDPPALVGEGYEPVSLMWSDCGWVGYSNGLITSDQEIQQSPEVVRRFVLATMQGVQYACTHEDSAAQNTLKFVQTMTLAAAKAGIVAACGIIWTPEAKANGLGYMSDQGAATTLGIGYEYLSLPKTVTAAQVQTNDFIPKIFPDTVVNAPKP